MILIKKRSTLTTVLEKHRQQNHSIGFVPTMGALHNGHRSLVERSLDGSDLTVVSIFVNPTQFNDPSDFRKYPVTLERDIEFLENAGAHILYLPPVAEIYPNGTEHLEKHQLDYLETILEGKYRPGHFQGVAQVMQRLLEHVQPDLLFMGQKDFQQCMVVRKLLDTSFNTTKLVKVPTVRETSGLAMSSRNLRLSEADREHATEIFKSLSRIKSELKPGQLNGLKQRETEALNKDGFRVDYIEIADTSLNPVENWDGRTPLVALVAAYLGEIRLIDNLLLTS